MIDTSRSEQALVPGPCTEPEAPSRRRADRARQVADVLRLQIIHGLVPDQTLPSETELAADFGVSRNTVREALDLLRSDGLVARTPGVGTVVVGTRYLHGLDRLQGLAETLRGHGTVMNEVRVAGVVPAPAAVAARLRLAAGSQVVYLERRRFADGLPISLDLTYLVPDLGEPLLDCDLAGQDVFALLETTAGVPLGHAEMTLEATSADRHSAALLQVPSGAPLLLLERLTHLADGRPVDLEYVRLRGDRISMRGSLARGPADAPCPVTFHRTDQELS
ncbi:GntR family transcriptional regulator [Nocardioides sp. KR10-350]|uniref:GntR family transcriptional regulator n=1 Tax=Nocardioides cheoyonin TaxID=3156615 RepID=UPI0032B56220